LSQCDSTGKALHYNEGDDALVVIEKILRIVSNIQQEFIKTQIYLLLKFMHNYF